MSWSSLTIENLHTILLAAQVDALRGRALAPGQADPLPAILADVTAAVRAEIRAGRRNRLSSDQNLLPPELKLAATHLAIEALQLRLPALALTPDQIRLANEARKLFVRVARGEVPVSPAEDPEGPLAAACLYGLELLRHRRHRASAENLSGL